MPTTVVTIGSPVGLHARPAKLLVEAARRQKATVRIGREGAEPVDASSILAVMALGVRGGEEVVVSAEGEDADAALAEIAELLARDLDSASA